MADAADAKALDALAAQTAVVLSTAGPFALYGSALVAACVKQGCHYVDITGEAPWMRELIDRHHVQAARDATRIIPCCGFDSVPSDLGAWLVAQAVWQQHGEPCVSVKACHSMRGGINGGKRSEPERIGGRCEAHAVLAAVGHAEQAGTHRAGDAGSQLEVAARACRAAQSVAAGSAATPAEPS